MKTKLTYLGGATYLIEFGSFRLLTDPGFDPEGTEEKRRSRARSEENHVATYPGGQDRQD